MANNGIEDILIGESYKPTKKSGKGFTVFIIILLIVSIAFAVWYFFINKDVVNEKEVFSKSILNMSSRKLQDKDFYSIVFKRLLEENSEMDTNITSSSTQEIEQLQGIDINNFDFELSSTNDLKSKNFNGKLLVKYSGNDFIEIQSIVNDNKFAVFSSDIVNRYVGVEAENFNDIFESDIDLNFIYEFINSEEIDLTEEERNSYLESYYQKIYNQIPEEKFSQKENIVISKNNNYIDVKAYEMTLTQSELNDVIVNILTELKNDEELLNSIISKESVKLDLNSNSSSLNENTQVENENNVLEEETTDNQEDLNSKNGESTTIQLVPVSEVNFQTAEEINEEENQDNIQEENLEEPTEENLEENVEDNENNSEEQLEEHIQEPEGLVLENNQEELTTQEDKDFTTSDLIKILLGRKVNISKDKIVEKIDDYINNLEGNGLTITVYVSDEKTEKISLTLPNENKLDIQILEDTEKESTIEFTYLYKNSDYKDGISINIDEIHNSASSSIKFVKNYIDDEKINKKETISIQTDGTKNSNTISNVIIITLSTNSDETKIVAENKIKFLSSDDIILDKLTDENSVFLDSLTIEDRDATIQIIKEKIQAVLEEKKVNMNLIDLNSKTSIVSSNLEDMTTNNYSSLMKNVLEDKINDLRNQANENGEEFTLQNLENLTIDGFEVTTNVEEDRAVVVIDVYTFIVDRDFNISDT